MIAYLLILIAGFAAGALVQSRRDRVTVEEHRLRAQEADHFRDAANRQADLADAFVAAANRLAAELQQRDIAINRLRDVVADQAVIVRRVLGRPQKRRVPAGSPS